MLVCLYFYTVLLTDPNMGERAIENIVCSIFDTTIYLEDHLLSGFNIILHEFENDGCVSAIK